MTRSCLSTRLLDEHDEILNRELGRLEVIDESTTGIGDSSELADCAMLYCDQARKVG